MERTAINDEKRGRKLTVQGRATVGDRKGGERESLFLVEGREKKGEWRDCTTNKERREGGGRKYKKKREKKKMGDEGW